jgi:hypothetical protein
MELDNRERLERKGAAAQVKGNVQESRAEPSKIIG